MTGKERLVAALDRKVPDHLPATTHHLMSTFLKKEMNGCSNLEFFAQMELDPIIWTGGDIYTQKQLDDWRIEAVPVEAKDYPTEKIYYHTPDKTLSITRKHDVHTSWQTECLLKEKNEIELIDRYWPVPVVDKAAVIQAAMEHPDCLIRGSMYGFYQPGCWQDLCGFYGVERMIMETFDDPEWVKEALAVIQKKKLQWADGLEGCPFDVIETGGGDASTTVISPAIFDEFVAPYDSEVIRRMQQKGQRVVYHTCGGMMPILEMLADMGPNALETFTPAGMGGDADLAKAKKRIGHRVCMIGGFDQFHYFTGCSVEDTRNYVRRCFEEAGEGGGFILSPSDHFFEADLDLIRAFAQEAKACRY